MNILAETTGGKSYKAHKEVIDHADRRLTPHPHRKHGFLRRKEELEEAALRQFGE